MLKIHDMACWGMDGIEMEEISTLLELLPAARGCDDVTSRRQPTDELPLRADAKLPERVCPSSKQGQLPAGPIPQYLQAAMQVVRS